VGVVAVIGLGGSYLGTSLGRLKEGIGFRTDWLLDIFDASSVWRLPARLSRSSSRWAT